MFLTPLMNKLIKKIEKIAKDIISFQICYPPKFLHYSYTDSISGMSVRGSS
jgi:hypothetical protein